MSVPVDHGLKVFQQGRESCGKLGACEAAEDGENVPDLDDQGLVLFSFNLAVCFGHRCENSLPHLFEFFQKRDKVFDEENDVSLLELGLHDSEQVRSAVLRVR